MLRRTFLGLIFAIPSIIKLPLSWPSIREPVEAADLLYRRKLKATWSMEAAQDLLSQHNISSEFELIKQLNAEINKGEK
jgi:hypothetical protein